jgi:hypothetical protein
MVPCGQNCGCRGARGTVGVKTPAAPLLMLLSLPCPTWLVWGPACVSSTGRLWLSPPSAWLPSPGGTKPPGTPQSVLPWLPGPHRQPDNQKTFSHQYWGNLLHLSVPFFSYTLWPISMVSPSHVEVTDAQPFLPWKEIYMDLPSGPVSFPFNGVDFLRHHKLIVDPAAYKLVHKHSQVSFATVSILMPAPPPSPVLAAGPQSPTSSSHQPPQSLASSVTSLLSQRPLNSPVLVWRRLLRERTASLSC